MKDKSIYYYIAIARAVIVGVQQLPIRTIMIAINLLLARTVSPVPDFVRIAFCQALTTSRVTYAVVFVPRATRG